MANQISRCLALCMLPLMLYSCASVSSNNSGTPTGPGNDDSWLIPSDEVYVGTGRDGIPSIDDPSFAPPEEIDFLESSDLVLGIKIGDDVRAYPHQILDYHEIVNDVVGDSAIAITFCPLTGSGIAWSRLVEGEPTTFGVSGLIHKNNLIAYDRKTESYWSQMMLQSVKGEKSGERAGSYHLIEMRWGSWKTVFPNSKVLTGVSGFDANYSIPAYGNYRNDNDNILFPIEQQDDRLERKAYGHGIFYNSSAQFIPIEEFSSSIQLMNLTVNGKEIVIAGSSEHRLALSFFRELSGNTLSFEAVLGEMPVIMEDQEGNRWNIFGEAVSGPREGETLEVVPSYNAYWFAWADFFGTGPKEPRIIYP